MECWGGFYVKYKRWTNNMNNMLYICLSLNIIQCDPITRKLCYPAGRPAD
jgi:hypothetical protein